MLPIEEEELRAEATALGWDDVGVTEARVSEEDIDAYQSWIESGYQAKMAYMKNAMRCDPQALLPGAKSAILFVSYYRQERLDFREDAGLVASYARGRDYHNLHRKRLKKFIQWLEERAGKKGIARGFSDSTPVLEKALAVRAGLGWFGKNTLLIHRQFGTFFLLSGLFTTLQLPYRLFEMRLPRCGSCDRCLRACPTGALKAPYQLDATRCLSYHLIESKEDIPKEVQSKNPGYLFGCDICQDVCPHNWRKKPTETEAFSENGVGPYLSLSDLSRLEEKPQELYGTPLQRRGVRGLMHTAQTLLKKEQNGG